jgi:hypothetical protein
MRCTSTLEKCARLELVDEQVLPLAARELERCGVLVEHLVREREHVVEVDRVEGLHARAVEARRGRPKDVGLVVLRLVRLVPLAAAQPRPRNRSAHYPDWQLHPATPMAAHHAAG